MVQDDPVQPAAPWWRFPLVWMVIGGPLAVVLAGIVTVWLALRTPDPVVTQDAWRRGLELSRGGRSALPAQLGRNHAATPVVAPENR